MNKFFIAFLLFNSFNVNAQRNTNVMAEEQYKKIFEYNYVERKPVFPATKDSLRNYYLSHFIGFDSLVAKCVANGDTAKYIRVHFEFVVDEEGTAYNGKFTYIGSTKYGSGSGDKKLKYFDDTKPYFNSAIKKMISYMPIWKPALQNNIRVQCRINDYFQLWLATTPEPK